MHMTPLLDLKINFLLIQVLFYFQRVVINFVLICSLIIL